MIRMLLAALGVFTYAAIATRYSSAVAAVLTAMFVIAMLVEWREM
jgi:hypothetical protein